MGNIKGYIYETGEYGLFKNLSGNRFVDHSGKIAESMKERGLLLAPIIVNENYEIIDGQNRFEACKKLNLPVYYVIAEGYGINECIAMNSVSKNWSVFDYIQSYADLGNYNYKYLQDMLNKYRPDLPTNTIIAITSGNIDFYSTNELRKGLYKIGDKGADYYDELLAYLQKFDVKGIKGNTDKLYKVIAYCYTAKEIDNEKLENFFEKYSYQIESVIDTKQASEAIEKVYNFKCNKSNYVFISSMYTKYAFDKNAINRFQSNKKPNKEE